MPAFIGELLPSPLWRLLNAHNSFADQCWFSIFVPIHPHILQVMDETEGWADFRSGYGSENRKFLAASFPGTPWILASATLDDEAIASIATSLGTSRLGSS